MPLKQSRSGAPGAPLKYGPLQKQVSYQLRRAYSYLYRTFVAELRDLQLAPGQYGTLVLISLNAGISQIELAQAAGLDGSTIVPIVERFIKLGWVRRVRRKSDRRHFALRITQDGQTILSRAQPLIAARESRLESVLNQQEYRALLDILSQVNNRPKTVTDRSLRTTTQRRRASKAARPRDK